MIGKIATSKAGHDKAETFVIVAADGDFVYLCDGRYRTVTKPKKKRRKHIQLIERTVSEDLLEKLRNREKITDEQIKYALKSLKQ